MAFKFIGYFFGMFMGVYYYLLLILVPAMLDRYLGDDFKNS